MLDAAEAIHERPCKLHDGRVERSGYGRVTVRLDTDLTVHESAHRSAWIEKRGSIPLGMLVLHTCDNRACVQNEGEGVYTLNGVEHPRQGHLWLGTPLDNMTDMVSKGRCNPRRGSNHPGAKVNEELVVNIRALGADGVPQTKIADTYGIAQSCVSNIINRISWTHVP